jgi:sulfite dehydrogenase (cytochrome) subunit A
LSEFPDISRRRFLRWLGAAGFTLSSSGLLIACSDSTNRQIIKVPPGQTLARLPEKTELIMLTDRPPQLETPLQYFRTDLTPNEAFFVRWHNAGIPMSVDTNTFRLTVGGVVQKPLQLSLDDLKKSFEPASVVAVCQCSGNARSYYDPRIPGGQWGNGAMGNARWTGVRLKDVLAKAGIKSGAIEVAFSGLDEAPLSGTPKFVKSLPIDVAKEDDILIAYEMNGAPLPMLNGFPLRLVVPGWYATYWMKALNNIQVLDKPEKGFWMAKAYRIPNNPEASEVPDKWATDTVPINRMSLRSVFVQPATGQRVKSGSEVIVEGVAFDSGIGVTGVSVSADGGTTWTAADLEPALDKYSWRRWKYKWKAPTPGTYKLMTTAANKLGENKLTMQWNHSGYQRNIIEAIEVVVV